MKNREAKLIPSYIQLRVDDNQMSVKYKVQDCALGINVNDVWIVFKPSIELVARLEEEIESAIKAKINE